MRRFRRGTPVSTRALLANASSGAAGLRAASMTTSAAEKLFMYSA
jgi:hypothetical protein